MAWQVSPRVFLLTIGAILLTVNSGYLFWRQQTNRTAPGQLLAACLVLSFAISVTAFTLEMASTTREAKIFWNQIQYIGDAPLAALLLGYILVYTGYTLTRHVYLLLFSLPAVTLVSVFTNSIHGQFWTSLTLETVGSIILLDNGHGPLFYLYIAYTYLFLMISLLLLVRSAFNSYSIYRRQTAALIIGTAVPALAGILYVLEPFPEPTPNYPGYAYLLTAGTITYSGSRWNLFTLSPIAHRTIIQQMDNGVITINEQGIVVNANPAVTSLVDCKIDDLLGQSASDALGSLIASFDLDSSARQREIVENNGQILDVTTQTLTNSKTTIGRLVILRDITERYRREQRLSRQNTQLELLNEMIRHDIRNEANLSLEITRRLKQDLDTIEASAPQFQDVGGEPLRQLERSGERIVELTTSARDLIGAISQLDEELEPVPLAPMLEREIANIEGLSTDVTVQIDTGIPDVQVWANDMLSSVFRNLLVNAVQHNDHERPQIVISVTHTENTVTVHVADNGPGIPDARKDAVFQEGRTLLENGGTGYGLYLVATLVAEYNGQVSVTDNDPRGSVFTVELLPVADQSEPPSTVR